MQPIRVHFLVLFVAIATLACEPRRESAPPKAIDAALAEFVGTWEIVSAQPAGIVKEAKKLRFQQDRTYAALDANDRELWAGTFDLDPSSEPKIWDHRSHDALKNGGDALGIYQLVDDSLVVACVTGVWKDREWIGKARPKEFRLNAADAVLELRRSGSTEK